MFQMKLQALALALIITLVTAAGVAAQNRVSFDLGIFGGISAGPENSAAAHYGTGLDELNEQVATNPLVLEALTELLEAEIGLFDPSTLYFKTKPAWTIGGRLAAEFSAGYAAGLDMNYRQGTVTKGAGLPYERFDGEVADPIDVRITSSAHVLSIAPYFAYYFLDRFQPYLQTGPLIRSYMLKGASYRPEFLDDIAELPSFTRQTHYGFHTAAGFRYHSGHFYTGLEAGYGLTFMEDELGVRNKDHQVGVHVRLGVLLGQRDRQSDDGSNFSYYGDIPDLPPYGSCMDASKKTEKSSADRITELLDSIADIQKELDEVVKALKDNPFSKEIEMIENTIKFIKFLNSLGELDQEFFEILQAYTACNDSLLISHLRNTDDAVQALTKVLSFIVEAMEIIGIDDNKKLSKAEEEALKLVVKAIKKKISDLQSLGDENNVEDVLAILSSIKNDMDWPRAAMDSLFANVWEDIQEAMKEGSKDLARKIAEILLKKYAKMGNAAGAVVSIGEDVWHFLDAIYRIMQIHDLVDDLNRKLRQVIDAMKEDGEYVIPDGGFKQCFWWDSKDSLEQVVFTAKLKCWCDPPGDWVESDLDVEPSDEGTTKKVTMTGSRKGKTSGGNDAWVTDKFKVKVPYKEDRPCQSAHCFVVVHITSYKNGKPNVTTSRIIGVAQ
jgi:hypothetical protein